MEIKKVNQCPICNAEGTFSPRYPSYVCSSCTDEAVDDNGLALKFFNKSMSGGFEARYADGSGVHNSHICFIKGKKCWANEAHMGGIIVQVFREK